MNMIDLVNELRHLLNRTDNPAMKEILLAAIHSARALWSERVSAMVAQKED